MVVPRLELLRQAENFVTRFLAENLPPTRFFHNIDHTRQVVEQSLFLASHYSIPEVDLNALSIAAWFHDIGYCKGNIEHEEESVNIALVFLRGYDLTPKFRSDVQSLIMATKLPSKPATLIQKILCDADMCHLGAADYEIRSLLLKKELEATKCRTISDSDWVRQNIFFFRSHHYFTDVAKQLWKRQKQNNLFWLLDQ
jgi:predicted metal-dependent HD superfamily phosphohydrolase